VVKDIINIKEGGLKMKWVLNTKKGTTVNHPKLGKLKGGIAYQFEDKDAMMVKGIYNIVIFDEVKKTTIL